MSSTGTIVAGEGFTVSKTGTGAYSVTYTTDFDTAPVVVLGAGNSGAGRGAYFVGTPGVHSLSVVTWNVSGGSVLGADGAFTFVAYTGTGAIGAAGPAGPKGDTGATGPAGPKGDTGASAYQAWLDAGNDGTSGDFLDWMRAAAGSGGTATVDTSGVVSAITDARDYAHADLWWLLGLICALFFGYFLYRAVTPRA